MDIQQFGFVLQDIKSQIKQLPPLQSLLKLTQKTTKKLQCLTLYSQMDNRQFDLQIQQQNIYNQIHQLYKAISAISQHPPSQQQIQVIKNIIDETKQKYMMTFDILSKQEDVLNQEFVLVEKMLQENGSNKLSGKEVINQIKELDEYDDQQDFVNADQQGKYNINQLQNQFNTVNPKDRVQKLKQQIDTINQKISKINHGQGKWFNTDHKDFVKIYNIAKGKDIKIISQGIRVLGMNQAEIMDHLQLYESYLQLQKEKKLATEQFRQIKFFQLEEKRQAELAKQEVKKQLLKVKKEKEIAERLKKKQEILLYKQKKAEKKK